VDVSAIKDGSVSDSVYMLLPSKDPPQPSEAKPMCLRMNYPMWKAVLLTYVYSARAIVFFFTFLSLSLSLSLPLNTTTHAQQQLIQVLHLIAVNML